MYAKKLTLISLLCLAPIMAKAQKAYESVVFRGKAADMTIKLTYADGYLGASQIKVTNIRTKVITTYLPELGVPDEQHKLNFNHYSAKQPAQKFPDHIVLDGIDDTVTAPKRVSGSYFINNAVIKFILTR